MEIEKRVIRSIAEQLCIAPEDVTPEKSIVADLGADSLDEFELIMVLEDEFNIDINDVQAEQIKTVQQTIDLIKVLTAKSMPIS